MNNILYNNILYNNIVEKSLDLSKIYWFEKIKYSFKNNIIYYDYDFIIKQINDYIKYNLHNILYYIGFNDIGKLFNSNISFLINIIFPNLIFDKYGSIFYIIINIDNFINKINIFNYDYDNIILINNLQYKKLINGIKSKNNDIKDFNWKEYIKKYIIENILFIINNYISKYKILYKNNNEDFNYINIDNISNINIINIIKILKKYYDISIYIYYNINVINNKFNFNYNNYILIKNNIINIIDKNKQKLDNRKINMLENNVLYIYNYLINDLHNFLINKKNVKIYNNNKNIIKFYISYKINFNEYEFKIFKLFDNLINSNIYNNSEGINHKYNINVIESIYEFSDEDILNYIHKMISFLNDNTNNHNIIYQNIKNIINNNFDYVDEQLKKYNFSIRDKNIYIEKDYNKLKIILKYLIYTPLELEKNYGLFKGKNNIRLPISEICNNLIKNNKLYIEMIHPKFCYYNKFQNKSLIDIINNKDYKIKSHQKQAVFGMFTDTIDYRTCHDYFFNNFTELEYENDKQIFKVIDIYSYEYNKFVVSSISKRENLFFLRYVNNGRLPYHKYYNFPNQENIFYDKIKKFKYDIKDEDINKNELYIGIIDISESIFFMFYNQQYDKIYLYDIYLNIIHEGLINSSPLITFMELQTICMYSNLYTYLHNEDGNYIFFSKYNIYDNETIYDEDVYLPLTISEFEETLKYYRKNLTLIKCNKYPSLNIDIPECIDRDELLNHFKDSQDDEKIYNSSQIYLTKINNNINDSCLLEHKVNYVLK